MLDRLHIPRVLFDAYPATFSGGEQQRINVARAVVARPRLFSLTNPLHRSTNCLSASLWISFEISRKKAVR